MVATMGCSGTVLPDAEGGCGSETLSACLATVKPDDADVALGETGTETSGMRTCTGISEELPGSERGRAGEF